MIRPNELFKKTFLELPEWMNDNTDGDVQLTGATFEKGGTFVTGSTMKSTNSSTSSSGNSEIQKLPSQSAALEDNPKQITNSVCLILFQKQADFKILPIHTLRFRQRFKRRLNPINRHHHVLITLS